MMRTMVQVWVIVLVAALPVLVSAQGRDLAGTWALDTEKSGRSDGPPLVVITQTASEVTLRLGRESARLIPFKLDGSETTLPGGEKSRAKWIRDRFEATLASDHGEDRTFTFSREGSWLVLEADRGHGPEKHYLKKATRP